MLFLFLHSYNHHLSSYSLDTDFFESHIEVVFENLTVTEYLYDILYPFVPITAKCTHFVSEDRLSHYSDIVNCSVPFSCGSSLAYMNLPSYFWNFNQICFRFSSYVSAYTLYRFKFPYPLNYITLNFSPGISLFTPLEVFNKLYYFNVGDRRHFLTKYQVLTTLCKSKSSGDHFFHFPSFDTKRACHLPYLVQAYLDSEPSSVHIFKSLLNIPFNLQLSVSDSFTIEYLSFYLSCDLDFFSQNMAAVNIYIVFIMCKQCNYYIYAYSFI